MVREIVDLIWIKVTNIICEHKINQMKEYDLTSIQSNKILIMCYKEYKRKTFNASRNSVKKVI